MYSVTVTHHPVLRCITCYNAKMTRQEPQICSKIPH